MSGKYDDTIPSADDDSMEVGYNRKAFRNRDDIPEEFRRHLGRRPYWSERPEWRDGFVPTDIADPTDPSEMIVLTDLSHAEIWDYFAKMAGVMTYNSFVSLISKEYDKLRYAVDEITRGVRVSSHIPDYPEFSDSVEDYIGLLRELQFVTSILWHRRGDKAEKAGKSEKPEKTEKGKSPKSPKTPKSPKA